MQKGHHRHIGSHPDGTVRPKWRKQSENAKHPSPSDEPEPSARVRGSKGNVPSPWDPHAHVAVGQNRRNSTQAKSRRQKDDGLRNPQPKRSGTTRTRDRTGLCRTPTSGNGARDRADRIMQRVRRMARSNLTWRADKSPLIPRGITSADARQPKKRPGRLRQRSVTTAGRQKGETTSFPCQSPMTNGTRQRGCGREVHTTAWLHPLSPRPTVSGSSR